MSADNETIFAGVAAILSHTIGLFLSTVGGIFLRPLGDVAIPHTSLKFNPYRVVGLGHFVWLIRPMMRLIYGTLTDFEFILEMQSHETQLILYFAPMLLSKLMRSLWPFRLAIGTLLLALIGTSAFAAVKYPVWFLLKVIDVSAYVLLKAPAPMFSFRGLFLDIYERLYFRIHRIDVAEARRCRDQKPALELYRYKPIESSKHIRLLRLRHRPMFSEPYCELIHTRLDEAPPFEALSYTWGERDPSIPLQVGGYRLLVTASVEEFLFYRSSVFTDHLLWIDAICINQSDNSEKSGQLLLMTDIYRQAKRTIVWLGPPEVSTQSKLLRQAIYPLIFGRSLKDLLDSFSEFAKAMDSSLDYLLPSETNQSSTLSSYRVIADLFSHPWFERAWVLQEAAISKDVRVMHKGTCVDLEHLFLVAEMISGNAERFYALSPFSQLGQAGSEIQPRGMATIRSSRYLNEPLNTCVRFMKNVRGLTQLDDRLSFMNLILGTRYLTCKDPRDKVFAILGLAVGPTFKADYSESVSQVFLKATIQALLDEYWFSTLVFAGRGYDREYYDKPSTLQLDLPSWAFNCVRESFCSPYVVTGAPKELQDKTGKVTFTPNILIIQIECTIVDSIKYLGPRMCLGTDVIEALKSLTQILPHQLSGRSLLVTETVLNKIKNWYLQSFHLVRTYWKATDDEEEQDYRVFWRICIFVGRLYDVKAFKTSISYYSELNQRVFGYFVSNDVRHWRDMAADHLFGYPLREVWLTFLSTVAMFSNLAGYRYGGLPFSITSEGSMAIVPPLTKEGDIIAHVRGGWQPMVLRRTNMQEREAELIGGCFIYSPFWSPEEEYSSSDWERWQLK